MMKLKPVIAAAVFFLVQETDCPGQYFGIGTAAPQVTLDLEGSGSAHLIRLRHSSGSPAVRLALNSTFAGMPYVGTDNAAGFGIVANNLQLITASKNGNVGVGNINPHGSAILDVASTSGGLLIPRMTAAQRAAIAAPATGLMVFDTDANAFYFFNGLVWITVDTRSELERITEAGRTGYRILNRPPGNYGNIGQDAVDLSFSGIVAATLGATGNFSFATGQQTAASGPASTAMGFGTSATGVAATAIGNLSSAGGGYAVALGANDTAAADFSFAAGVGAAARGLGSVAMGHFPKAGGNYSVALGRQSSASGISSIASGFQAAASGNHAAAICIGDTALGTASFAAGYYSRASGDYAVAIGRITEASGNSSLALGRLTTAAGFSATALGDSTTAWSTASMAAGNRTIAKSFGEFVIGTLNDTLAAASGTVFRGDSNRLFTVGNGTGIASRQTAFVIQQNGYVGIGVRRPASQLHVNGEVGINGSNVLELGADVAPKEVNAGKIGYQTFTPGALDITGAGTGSGSRRIKLWTEGGLEIAGSIVQEAVSSPLLQSGWQNYGAGFAAAGYWKDKEGMVHLRGLIGNGNTSSGSILFTLPAGYRPAAGRMVFAVLSSNGMGRVDINTTGEVFIDNMPGNAWLNLSGILFRTN